MQTRGGSASKGLEKPTNERTQPADSTGLMLGGMFQ